MARVRNLTRLIVRWNGVVDLQGNAGDIPSMNQHTTKCSVCIDCLLPSHIALLLLPLTLHNPFPTCWCKWLKQTKTSTRCILYCLVHTRLVWQDMPYVTLQSAIQQVESRGQHARLVDVTYASCTIRRRWANDMSTFRYMYIRIYVCTYACTWVTTYIHMCLSMKALTHVCAWA